MSKSKLHYRAIATLAKSEVWIKNLKPELMEIKNEKNNEESLPETTDKAIIRDVERSTTNKIINRIIRLVERAENKITK